jgi:hypothetical protein
MLMEGKYRRFSPYKAGEAAADVRITHQESLAVAQVEAPGFELTRASRRFHLGYNGSAPTGIAPVQAIPTTAAQWTIWNADPSKTYWFETLGAFPISGTPGVGGLLLASIFTLPAQTGFSTGLAVASASNGGMYSKAAIKSGVTITAPATPLWFPVADNQPGAVGGGVGGNQIINRAIAGRIAVPPLCGLGLAVLALAGTTPLFVPIAEWTEIETDLE